MKTPVYLDYQATTPMDPKVLDAMLPYFSESFGNPHSITHRFGWEAEAAVEIASERVADLIKAEPRDIIFTSGATESNNLAIKGVLARSGERRHVVSVVTEHKCLIEAINRTAEQGVEVTWLSVSGDGRIDLEALQAAIRDDTALVSVMAANNEIGTLQSLEEIGTICRAAGVLFHTDAAQAFGKIPLDVEAMNIDLMSISAHKIYGPKGVGGLYVGRKARRKLRAEIDGGGQQRGLRSGTLAPALCAGLGVAAEIAAAEMDTEQARLEGMFTRFLVKIQRQLPNVKLNGSRTARLPGNLNLTFPGLDGELLISNLREIAISSGAACASATSGPSYVLQALGLMDDDIQSSLRIGFGRFTTDEEIDFAAAKIIAAVEKLGASR